MTPLEFVSAHTFLALPLTVGVGVAAVAWGAWDRWMDRRGR